MNTLMPLGNRINKNGVTSTLKNGVASAANAMKNGAASVVNTAKSIFNSVSAPMAAAGTATASAASAASAATASSGSSLGFYISMFIFVTLVILFIVVFTYFRNDILNGWNNFISSLRTAFNSTTPTSSPAETESTKDDTADATSHVLLEKIMPGSKEVFNISKNNYTFYDAEPLCKALGAELATYDQVKEAWSKGADWCNYGWVKGQQALYPTQKETYDKIQAGPEGDRMKCGEVGLNGGYFDNPEERFGVNCYGPKPPQSLHDAITQEKGAPVSPDVIDFNQKVSKFKTDAGNMGLMPYNYNKWSSS